MFAEDENLFDFSLKIRRNEQLECFTTFVDDRRYVCKFYALYHIVTAQPNLNQPNLT